MSLSDSKFRQGLRHIDLFRPKVTSSSFLTSRPVDLYCKVCVVYFFRLDMRLLLL